LEVYLISYVYLLFDAWNGLCFLLFVEDNSSQTNKNKVDSASFVEARVDIRKFAQFLCGQQVNPLQVICSKFLKGVMYVCMLYVCVKIS